MFTKKTYIWGSVCAFFVIGYFFRPTIVVRENYMAGGPKGFGPGRGIASVGAIAEPKALNKPLDGNLIRGTQHFCDKQYHKDSCLSFLIQCGTGCLDFIGEEAKTKMRLEIQKLKAANQNQSESVNN